MALDQFRRGPNTAVMLLRTNCLLHPQKMDFPQETKVLERKCAGGKIVH
jgi:hypothetical protein